MRIESFSAVSELRQAILKDAQTAERYAVRFVLVSGVDAWRDLLDVLRGLGHRTIRLSTLARSDALPNMDRVLRAVADAEDSIVLCPLGEMLRLAPNTARAYITGLVASGGHGMKRVYVPLLGVSDAVRAELDCQHQYLTNSPPVWSLYGSGTSSVVVTAQRYSCLAGRLCSGLASYFETWEEGGAERILLLTRNAPFIAESLGSISVVVLGSGHAVVQACCSDANGVGDEGGRESDWNWLAGMLRPNESLDSACARLLNFTYLDLDRIWATWPSFDETHRWLAWLWIKLRCRDDDPLSRLISASTGPENLVELVANAPYGTSCHLSVASRRHILMGMAPRELPGSFWAAHDAITDPAVRLAMLPGLSALQREAIVRAVGELVVRGDASETWRPILRETYPELDQYLKLPLLDEWCSRYFHHYELSRLQDGALPELLSMVDEWASEGKLWQYGTRANALASLGIESEDVLWVDGLGVEWAGLLQVLLRERHYAVQVDVARANLPSTTAENREWQTDRVMRALDSFAHGHEYRYPASLVKQIEIVQDIALEAERRLSTTRRIAIVGDHGLTRFASAGDRVDVPTGFQVHRWGRYALQAGAVSESSLDDGPWIRDGHNLILARHGLFRGGARTTGEVHGGATPEESLVPIIVVQSDDLELPEIIGWSEDVRLDVGGRGILSVELSREWPDLALQVEDRVFEARPETTRRWAFDLQDLPPGKHLARLVCRAGSIGPLTFTCSQGITQNDLGF